MQLKVEAKLLVCQDKEDQMPSNRIHTTGLGRQFSHNLNYLSSIPGEKICYIFKNLLREIRIYFFNQFQLFIKKNKY
jgi:hypothetical protein